MGWLIDMEWKGCESIGCKTHIMTLNCDLTHDLDPLIFKVKFWKSHNSGMGCPIDMERKGCESIECWTHVVISNYDLTHDLDLEFSMSNFEIAVSHVWEVWSTWNNRDMSR